MEEFSERLARSLESLIEQEGPETIAAMIVEPIQGAGGVILPPKGYFQRMSAQSEKEQKSQPQP